MTWLKTASVAALAALLVCATASAQTATPAAEATLTPAADVPLGSGPYRAIMLEEASLPGQTIYRPADVSALPDGSLPIVLWGNGACANQGNAFRAFLSDIASYGYVVIALGPIDAGYPLYEAQNVPAVETPPPVTPPPPRTSGNPMGPPRTRAGQMIEALDWLQGPAGRATSYYSKLNTQAVAVMGMSCGGVQAIEAAADPRVRTAVIWNSGLFPDGTDMGGGGTMTKDDLLRMNGAIAYISGDQTDIAFNNGADDYERLARAGRPVFRAWQRGVGHGGNYGRPNGGEFSGVAVAWLNWQLKADARAGLMFRGPDCGICVNPRWVAQSSNLD